MRRSIRRSAHFFPSCAIGGVHNLHQFVFCTHATPELLRKPHATSKRSRRLIVSLWNKLPNGALTTFGDPAVENCDGAVSMCRTASVERSMRGNGSVAETSTFGAIAMTMPSARPDEANTG